MSKIKLSREQWQLAGRKAGWLKTAQETPLELETAQETPLETLSLLSRGKYDLRNEILDPFLPEEEFLKIASDPATPYGILNEMRGLRKCTPQGRKLIEENPSFINKMY